MTEVDIENLRAMTSRKILARHDPTCSLGNHMDWYAWFDDLGEDESPYGFGPTEHAAIKDLLNDAELLDEGSGQ